MVFGRIFKGLKKETEKRTGIEEERGPEERAAESRYYRLAAWIKTTYGKHFRDGMQSADVETQLEGILRELETKKEFKKYPKIASGFRAYISERKYGDLVKVSE